MFHGKKYFSAATSCLYLYDSSMPVPVYIRKQSRSTDFWRLALIYRVVGLPTSGAGVEIPCRRSTDFWRRREVCAKSVDRLLASKVLGHTYNTHFLSVQHVYYYFVTAIANHTYDSCSLSMFIIILYNSIRTSHTYDISTNFFPFCNSSRLDSNYRK